MLNSIHSPSDIKKLSIHQLKDLCKEIRQFLIEHAAKNGGHFASSLGVVELTVALHYVFEMPNDDIVWDVGHQAYVHKLLTGRKNQFDTMRKKNGLFPFPKPSESKYDSSVAGHASVSLSTALGMDIAAKQLQQEKNVIAVIGDGALTGGQAFEALNNASSASIETDMIIVFNDNEMSIDPNIGGLQKSFLSLTQSIKMNRFKKSIENIFGTTVLEKISGIKQKIKNFIYPHHNFFEALHLQYYGPYNGHNLENVIEKLNRLKKIKGPKILHLLTTKGKGFIKAEKNQTHWHATTGFNIDEKNMQSNSSEQKKQEENNKINKNSHKKFQEVFGETLLDLMKKDDTIVGVTPAMLSGSSMTIPQKIFPKRIFDVGIAEPHAVTFSAGMAARGLTVFCNIYSTFAQRAIDQIIHDCAIEKIPVIFCFDRSGFVGEDGETHQGLFDISIFSSVPNITILAPRDGEELEKMMRFFAQKKHQKNPVIIRYPKGLAFQETKINIEKKEIDTFLPELIYSKNSQNNKENNKDNNREIKKKIAILSVGSLCYSAIKYLEKQKNISDEENKKEYSLYDMRQITPLPKNFLDDIFQKYEKIITVEEGIISGGFGSLVLEYANEKKYSGEIIMKGVKKEFITHATREEQLKNSLLGEDNIL